MTQWGFPMTRTKEFKIYPSAAGTVEFGQVVTSKSHICLRSQWFKHRGVRTKDINNIYNIYKLIGDYWEGRTAKELRKGRLDDVIEGKLKIEAEKTYRRDIGGIGVSGRGDFIQTDLRTGEVFVIECKAVTSSARRSKCIRKRQPDAAHVVQLVITMMLADATEGELRYAYVHFDNEHENFMIPFDTDKGDSKATMPVEIRGAGTIFVDGSEWGELDSIYKYMLKASKEVPGGVLPDRPFVDQTDPYSSPCNRCVFSNVCDKTDAEEITVGTHLAPEVLLVEAQKCADEEASFIPKIFKPKRPVKGD